MHGASPSPSPVTPSDREREESVDVAPPTALSSLDLLSGVAAQLSAEEATDAPLPPPSSHHTLHPPPSSGGTASCRLPSLQQQHLAPRVPAPGEGGAGGAKRARHSLYPPVPHHQHQRLPRPPHLRPHRPQHPHPHPQPRPLPSNGFAPPRLPPPTNMAHRPVYHFQPPVQQGHVARAPSPPMGSLGRARQVEKEAWEGRRVVPAAGGGPVPSSSVTAPPVWRPGYGAPPPQHSHPHPHGAPEQEKHNHLSYKPLYERRTQSSASTSSFSTGPAPPRPSGTSVSYRRPPPRHLDTSFLSSTTTSLKLPSSYGTSIPTPVSAPLPLPLPSLAPAAGSLGVSAQGRTIYSTPSSSGAAAAEGRRGSMGGGPRTRASVSGGGGGAGGEMGGGGGAESAKGLIVGNGKGMEPIVSSTLWEDERTIVMQVLVEGHVVARRADNDWINSTKLLNMAGLTRGKRDMYLKNEPQRVVFRRGALHLKGVWLPLEAAERLAHSYNLHSRLYPLFEPRIQKFLFTPLNRDRTTQLVRAARAREAMPKPEDEQGIAEEEKKEREERSRGLERLLRRLEVGLGLVEREEGDSEDEEEEEERAAGQGAKGAEEEQAASTSLAAQHPATSLHAVSSSSTSGGEPPLVTASYYSSYAASTPSQQAAADAAPRVNSSFALSLQHLQRLQQQAPSSSTDDPSRRPSLDMGFTHDYQTPVSWYNNPTPPEGANAEYISAGDIARRLSSVSVLGEGGDDRELGAVMEGEEMSEWGTEGVWARSRPPPVGGGFGRRMSAPVLQSTAMATGGRYVAGGGGGRPATSGAHPFAQQQHQQQNLAVLPPSAEAGRAQSVPAGSNDYTTFNFPPSSAPPVSSNPHPFTFAAPAPHHQPAQTDSPPTFDLPALLADLHALQQQRPGSPSFASSNVATYSPLSRFNATRLSIDSAAEAVYPHVGLGAASLVAPHTEHAVEQYEAPVEGDVSGGNYSWAPLPPPSQYGQGYSASSSSAAAAAPSPGAFLPEETLRTAPGRTSFSKQYLSALSAATSAAASTSSTSTAPSPAYSTLPSASESASASPEAYYSFPSTSASTTATSLSVRSSSKRILEELDALDALDATDVDSPSSAVVGGENGSVGRETPYEHPAHSLSSSRRRSVITLEVAAVAGQARHETPGERRDRILGAMVALPVEQREEEVEVEEGRDVKRRRLDMEPTEGGEGKETDIEVRELEGEAVLLEDIEVEEGEVVEGC